MSRQHESRIPIGDSESMKNFEYSYRRGETTVESESPLGIGIDLEKKWVPDHNLSTQPSGSSMSEPEKALTKSDGGDDASETPRESPDSYQLITAQDWNGPDDPENPHNWPLFKKIYHLVPISILGFTVFVSYPLGSNRPS